MPAPGPAAPVPAVSPASQLGAGAAAPSPVLSELVAAARRAQRHWRARPPGERLAPLRALRHRLARDARALAAAVAHPRRSGPGETLVAEILPLAEACRFLERNAARLLADRHLADADRPRWLPGVSGRVARVPWGVVLLLGPSNYPLLLPGVQALQALAAGNAVLWKPGRNGRGCAEAIAGMLYQAGLPPSLLQVLGEGIDDGLAAIETGVDKVVLTGSAATGRRVLRRLSDRPVPACLELSGCDAVVVLPRADPAAVAAAVAFGLTFNGGATCIAPRRVFVPEGLSDALEGELARRLVAAEPTSLEPTALPALRAGLAEALAAGARVVAGGPPNGSECRPTVLADVPPDARLMRDGTMAPVTCLVSVHDEEEALRLAARCPLALGATLFGDPARCLRLAERLDTGVVLINDMIVPTADPRVPFGGRGASGYGTTRGAEGLLEMTRPKAVLVRRGRWRPHFEHPADPELSLGLLSALHSPALVDRLRGWARVLTALRRLRRRRTEETMR